MGFDPDRRFWVDDSVYEHMSLRESGAACQQEWEERFNSWRADFPDMAKDWDLAWSGTMREGWREALPRFEAGEEIATRSAGQKVMAAFGEYAPTMPYATSPLPPRPLWPWHTAQCRLNCTCPRFSSASHPPAFSTATGGTWFTQ